MQLNHTNPKHLPTYKGCVNIKQARVNSCTQNKQSGALGAWLHIHPQVTSRIKRVLVICVVQQHQRSADLMVAIKTREEPALLTLTEMCVKMARCWMITARDGDVCLSVCLSITAPDHQGLLRPVSELSPDPVHSSTPSSIPPLPLLSHRKRLPLRQSERQAEQRRNKTRFPGFFFKIKARRTKTVTKVPQNCVFCALIFILYGTGFYHLFKTYLSFSTYFAFECLDVLL